MGCYLHVCKISKLGDEYFLFWIFCIMAANYQWCLKEKFLLKEKDHEYFVIEQMVIEGLLCIRH